MRHRRDIDGLRAIAVLAVMLSHARLKGLTGGYVGVDVFFVISGFLITSAIMTELEAGQFSLARFYERRCRRILPALFLVISVTTPFAWLFLTPPHVVEFSKSALAAVGFVSNIFFWRGSGYFSGASELKPLLHTWSLGIEEQFYLFFPLLMIALWRWFRRAVLAVIVGLMASSLLLAQWTAVHYPSAAFFLLLPRVWELLVGAVAAELARGEQAGIGQKPREGLCIAGLGLIVFAVFTFDNTTAIPGLPIVAPTLGTAILLRYSGPDTIVGRLLGKSILVGIGLVSYSAYLWHQPVLAFARRLGVYDSISLSVFGVGGALALACLSWRYVEQPFRNPRNIPLRPFARSIMAAVVVIVGAGAIALLTPLPEAVFLARLTPSQSQLHDRIEEAKATGGDAAMYSDNDCKFWAKDVDADFNVSFRRCAAQHGQAVVVVGDSHAMDLYNAVARSVSYPFVVGVSQGGCRPDSAQSGCPYKNIKELVDALPRAVGVLLYTQSGGYFLTLNRPPIRRDSIKRAAEFIESLRPHRVIWLGPQNEWIAADLDSSVFNGRPERNPYIDDVDNYLAQARSQAQNSEYISKNESIGAIARELVVDGRVTYSDIDHWSSYGEQIFGRVLVGSLGTELTRKRMPEARFFRLHAPTDR